MRVHRRGNRQRHWQARSTYLAHEAETARHAPALGPLLVDIAYPRPPRKIDQLEREAIRLLNAPEPKLVRAK